jgi:hypothetical protein
MRKVDFAHWFRLYLAEAIPEAFIGNRGDICSIITHGSTTGKRPIHVSIQPSSFGASTHVVFHSAADAALPLEHGRSFNFHFAES